ncbi:hypothetical protein C7445_11259 [Alicyclobacillus sacchari]|uniref:Uncharacterized protein n=1 Tax=Alicyclobacillus sacchari TaxID=392010 RepID=A0A4R8LIF5_9BACL|nr:hypothetical protein C7445_11259 [Alicyclobacillus sacchari]
MWPDDREPMVGANRQKVHFELTHELQPDM